LAAVGIDRWIPAYTAASGGINGFSSQLYSVFDNQVTLMNVAAITQDSTGTMSTTLGALHNSTTSFDGFTISPSAGNITGTIQVFGYND
jgi:hypothetical protein